MVEIAQIGVGYWGPNLLRNLVACKRCHVHTVVDASEVVQHVPHTFPQDLIRGVIERFGEFRPQLDAVAQERKGLPLAQVRVRPPLPKPTHIIGIVANYLENGTVPTLPIIDSFQKSSPR